MAVSQDVTSLTCSLYPYNWGWGSDSAQGVLTWGRCVLHL